MCICRLTVRLTWTAALHSNFDLIITSGSAQAPKALFMGGQMTFFKNNEKMEKIPYRYKPLSSIEHVELLKPGDHGRGLDEGEYSDLYLNKVSSVDSSCM